MCRRRHYDRNLVDEILAESERGPGHTAERHYTIDRAAMIRRLSRPDVRVDVVTAFPVNHWGLVVTSAAAV